MVGSFYRKIGKDTLWYQGQIGGVDEFILKITNGPWLRIKEEKGEFVIEHPTGVQHGTENRLE